MTMMTILLLLMSMSAALAADHGPLLDRALNNDPTATMQRADGTFAVWVHFTDRGLSPSAFSSALAAATRDLPQRTLDRRAKTALPGEPLVDARDLPVAPQYIEAISALGAEPRRQSRWFNAASFNATRDQITALSQLSFVDHVELVAMFRRDVLGDLGNQSAPLDGLRKSEDHRYSLDYGGSLTGLEQINVPPVHAMGLSGQGVFIGMLDNGFMTTHEAFSHLDIIDAYDFVNDDDIVGPEEGDHPNQANHGTQTLSVLAGFADGSLVGTAFNASVILAKTEDMNDETPIEEDYWVAGLEWVESLGADIVTSSLGYYYWYEFADLDGNTALTTIAADMAVGRGICVFNSAGNQRGDEDFPYLTVPADGDSVIAVGAVDSGGLVANFSSPGPTADGRTKPDLTALGVGTFTVAYWNDTGYTSANGTSFATPMLAGVAALLLERMPTLTPMQVREALRSTADNHIRPDNDYGWGIVDAEAALAYFGPTIDHTPLIDTEDVIGPYIVTATITSPEPLDSGSLALSWRVDNGPWQQVGLNAAGDDVYTAEIPGQSSDSQVDYYIEASDVEGLTITSPLLAPAEVHGFLIGTDQTPPTLVHTPLMNQVPQNWPPTVRATADDNLGIDRIELTYQLNGGADEGPFSMDDAGGFYELLFPLAAGAVQVGDVVTYQLTAFDVAGAANSTTSGPFDVPVVADLGSILVINNGSGSAAAADEDPESQDDGKPQSPITQVTSSADDITSWLSDAGYLVTMINHGQISPGDFAGFDVIVAACGNNGSPLAGTSLRNMLVEWAQGGGAILVESGELAYDTFVTPGYPELGEHVLHSDSFGGDLLYEFPINANESDHPFLNRPNMLRDPFQLNVPDGVYDFSCSDVAGPADEALAVVRTPYSANSGGIILYDENSAPEAGQSVYITFDVSYLDESVGRALVENAVSYLVATEPPGGASIAGLVTLADGGDPTGATVSCRHAATTVGPDGSFTLDGIYGGTHILTASLSGYAPVELTVEIMDDEVLGGQQFMLLPVTEVNLSVEADLPIPDYDPIGITSTLDVIDAGQLLGITVDLDISHNYIGHLEVKLISPSGTAITLHDNSGHSADDIVGNYPLTLSVDGPGDLADFVGEDALGEWTLHVADTNYGVWGTLNSWGLNLLLSQGVTAVEPDTPVAVTRLVGNAPNPFNPQTMIAFELASSGTVRLDIHDLRGRLVRRLVSGHVEAGPHQVRWDGRDGAGRDMASGVYFSRLIAEGVTQHQKMTLVR